MSRLRALVSGPMAWTLATLTVIALLVGVGRLVPSEPAVALAVALTVMLIGLTMAEPTIIPLLAMPLLLVVARVSAGGIELSISDVVLFLAFWPAVIFGQRPFSAPMRTLLWLTVIYQVATLFTVVANPYTANVVEWFHAWFLTGGAIIIGWALGRAGRGAVALTLLLVGICVIGASTVVQGVAHLGNGLQAVYPSWPFAMHKNFAGTLLGFGALLAYINPSWMRWPRALAMGAFVLCSAGLLFTQSRQAIVALAVSLAVVVLRSDESRRRSKLTILAAAGGLAIVGSLVRDQLESGNQFNSVFQRINWFQDSMDVWLSDPLFGAGLRWWYTNRFTSRFQPPNAELEVLTSAGLVGLVAFAVLMLAGFVILKRLPAVYGTLAFTMLLSRFVQGQLDLFWIAVQVSVPFVIVGICVGAEARSRSTDEVALLTSSTRAGSALGQ